MGKNIVFRSSIIVLMFCIGHGDGRWKKRDKKDLVRDIDVFQRIAEKIEHEIEVFYEDYPEERIKGDNIDKIQKEYIKNLFDHKTGTGSLLEGKRKTEKLAFTSNISKEISKNAIQSKPAYVAFQSNDSSIPRPNWPKFEDILLEMGKRYDWKNDRWIKVKRKPKSLPKFVENSVSFHEKHKFSYRTVKLNRKSRRNVVIAVTAVR